MNMLEIDELGLDPADRRVLDAIIEHYAGGPVGLDTVAAITGDERSTIEDFFEPDVLFADRHNENPITSKHGAPLRLVVPKLYFWKGAKWVTGVEFMAEDKPGFWNLMDITCMVIHGKKNVTAGRVTISEFKVKIFN